MSQIQAAFNHRFCDPILSGRKTYTTRYHLHPQRRYQPNAIVYLHRFYMESWAGAVPASSMPYGKEVETANTAKSIHS